MEQTVKNNIPHTAGGSWFYCGGCAAALGYVYSATHRQLQLAFTCACGCFGTVELPHGSEQTIQASAAFLQKKNNQLCCPHDETPFFSLLEKKLVGYSYSAVCATCSAHFSYPPVPS